MGKGYAVITQEELEGNSFPWSCFLLKFSL